MISGNIEMSSELKLSNVFVDTSYSCVHGQVGLTILFFHLSKIRGA